MKHTKAQKIEAIKNYYGGSLPTGMAKEKEVSERQVDEMLINIGTYENYTPPEKLVENLLKSK